MFFLNHSMLNCKIQTLSEKSNSVEDLELTVLKVSLFMAFFFLFSAGLMCGLHIGGAT